jgi:hypothetical protein
VPGVEQEVDLLAVRAGELVRGPGRHRRLRDAADLVCLVPQALVAHALRELVSPRDELVEVGGVQIVQFPVEVDGVIFTRTGDPVSGSERRAVQADNGGVRPSVAHRRAIRFACAGSIASIGLWSGTSFAASAVEARPSLAPPPAASLRHAGAAPGWKPLAGQPVPVTSAGDVAQVDLRDRPGRVRVMLYLTNLPELRKGYASFVLPIGIWESRAPGQASSWRRAGATFLSDARGSVELELAGGRYYDLTIEPGGSLVAVPEAASHSPGFYAVVG